ncbi:MAG: sugar nucleotide-binding protein [Rhodospirillaceae bacterium]|nr:sugar nucleotide-binding protein [Rhodospirillaceae bacterium]
MMDQQSKRPDTALNKSILIVGGDGQIGAALAMSLPRQGFSVEKTTRRRVEVGQGVHYLDLATPQFDLPLASFDSVVICAAITNMALCEADPAGCARINTHNTIKLIEACAAARCFVVYLSTNAVFDGQRAFCSVGDAPNPQTVYGKSKRAVETYIAQQRNLNAAVLRLTKVVTDDASFIAGWRKSVENGADIVAFTNRHISALSLQEVSDAVGHLLQARKAGLFQLGGREEITYYEYAKRYFAADPVALKLIKPAVDPAITKGAPIHASLATHLPPA